MKEKKKKRRQEELPDYTVAHMDVDGMPWNSKRPWQLLPGDPARESRKKRSLQYAEPDRSRSLQDGEHILMQTVSCISRRTKTGRADKGRTSLSCLARPEGFSGSRRCVCAGCVSVSFILCKCMVSIKKESSGVAKSANIGFNPHAARSESTALPLSAP